MTAHDGIVDAVLALLRQAPPVTADVIEEDIDGENVPEDAQEAVSVRMASSTPQRAEIFGAPIDWTTEVAITCFARADESIAQSRASRALHAKVYARLMADPTLGGLAFDLFEPQLTADRDVVDTRLGSLTATYTVQHRTAARTLEPWQ